MSTNYRVAVWERDCEKMQNQFESRLYTGKIRDRQGSVVTLVFTGILFIAYIAGLYFTQESVLLTQIFCMYLFGASLILLISGLLKKRRKKDLENKISREKDLQIFYEAHKEGVITRIKYIQDNTITYEIKNKDNNCLFNWCFTADVIEKTNETDIITIFATDDIVKIEVPVNSF